jgi:potassium-transporting ATPase KdpC subunit
MLNILISAVRISVVTLTLCGLIYPLAVTGVAQLAFPAEANGSLIRGADGTFRGSLLIGQQWDDPQWFHGRPSAITGTDPEDATKTIATPYNAATSGGSNYGPTSQALADRLTADRKALEEAQPDLAGGALPADMLTSSASGLDPEISPANADLQVARVAQARQVSEDKIRALVQQQVIGRDLGVFGEPRVNVLTLNLALQRGFPKSRKN